MANDIIKSKSGEPIKNGTVVVTVKTTGPTEKDFLNTYVSNAPAIADIESKYDLKFDDPSYYYGIGNENLIGG
jgi:hypothetical protein